MVDCPSVRLPSEIDQSVCSDPQHVGRQRGLAVRVDQEPESIASAASPAAAPPAVSVKGTSW